MNLPGMSGENASFWVSQGIRILALIFMIVVLVIVGQLTKLTLGRRLINLGQRLLLHLPLVSFIYSTCKQIADAMQSTSGGMFRQAVLFEYPMPGSYAVGFVTNEQSAGEIRDKLGRHLVSVFLPTTPNPTSGFLLMIPREQCTFLDMSVSDAMKLIVSVGTVLPGQIQEQVPEQKKTE